MYIGREKELKYLKEAFASDEMEVIIIYGRRRVGKTELIKEAILNTDISSCYYVCNFSGEQKDLESFQDSLYMSFPQESFAYFSFEKTLEALFKKSENQKIILAIDEFPYLQEDVKGIGQTLQNLIDEYKRNGKAKLKLILSGSYLHAIADLLGPEGALYKRETRRLLLRPMDYLEAADFFPQASQRDKAVFYSVFGGLPYCLEKAAKYKTVKEAIINLVLDEGAVLSDFDGFVTQKELTKLKGSTEVLSAIAEGNNTFSLLKSSTSFKESMSLTRVIHSMLDMDLIERVSPINDKNNKKKTFYVIKDGYLSFYYSFIHPHLSALAILGKEIFYDRYIAKGLYSVFCPKRFETIVKEYLIRQNRKGKLNRLYEDIGTYWYDDPINKKNGQFDVALRDGKDYLLVECKFLTHPVRDDTIEEEIRQTKLLKLGSISLGFASLNGFDLKENKGKYYCISLQKMYSED
jgi:AAA+ ATPase superfamily predicted ATPase